MKEKGFVGGCESERRWRGDRGNERRGVEPARRREDTETSGELLSALAYFISVEPKSRSCESE